MNEREGSKKNLYKVLTVLGTILILVSIAGMFLVGSGKFTEEKNDPRNIFYADETDEYVYTEIQCMTDSVAYYEHLTKLYYYIAFDEEFYPIVVALTSDELSDYQTYIEWTYYGTEENKPEVKRVTGYSQPFEETLKQYVLESYNELYGAEYVTLDNFAEYFGEYYICPGKGTADYTNFNYAVYILMVGVVLLVFGASKLNIGMQETSEEARAHIFETPKSPNRVVGVIGAILGALIGVLLWAGVGALGWISGWIGMLMITFSYTGYKLFAKTEDRFGWILSVILGFILVIPSTYLGSAWGYYQALNENMPGYYSLLQALEFYPDYLFDYEAWSDILINVIIGYVLMIGSVSRRGGFTRRKKEAPQPEPQKNIAYYNNFNNKEEE